MAYPSEGELGGLIGSGFVLPCRYNYWLLYRLPELPDPNNPPGNQLIAPVGVDELMVEDGEHYLYWYKKL